MRCRSAAECHEDYVQQVKQRLQAKGLDPEVSQPGAMIELLAQNAAHVLAAAGPAASACQSSSSSS